MDGHKEESLIAEEKIESAASSKLTNVAIGVAVVGGTSTSVVGIFAAGTSATGAISAVGATIGGATGAVFGSSVGLVTGGIGIAATAPFAVTGAAIGGWAGPALALVGIGTAPAWALPVAIGGGAVALVGASVAGYKLFKRKVNGGSEK